MAFPSGWGRIAPIVIQAVDAPLSNFPVHLDQSCFPSEATNAGSSYPARSDGGDLRFTTDAAGANQIPCEVSQWVQDPTTPHCSVYVQVPSLTYTGTTTIYVWYNNPSATMPAANSTYGSQNVWDSNFVGVYHLNNASTISDSTSNAATGSVEGAAMSTAQTPVGLGLTFDGTDNAISFGTTNYNDSVLEFVLKLTSTSDQIICGKSTAGSYSQTIWSSGSKPTAYYSITGSTPYTYTFADSINDSTTNYEYWAQRNRSTAGGTVVSKARPTNEQTHMAWCNDGTYMYSIGGHQGSQASPVAYNNRYNPASDSWSSLTAIPTARWGMACCYLSGNIYCFGGATNATTGSSNLDIYNISGNSWSSGTALPSNLTTAYFQGQRACTDGTNIFVFCGPNLSRYNVGANTWTTLTSCPTGTGNWQSLICDGTHIYVIGGFNLTTNVCRYTIAGDSWDTAYDTGTPYNAWAKVCEPVGDGTYMIGFGRNGTTEQYTCLYNYNPSTKVWTQLPCYEEPTNAVAAAVFSGILYVYGFWVIGKQETYSSGHHAAYNISGVSWSTLPPIMEFHRDGVWISGDIQTSVPWAGTGKQYLGRQDAYGSLYASPIIGEFRRSKSARSRAWIKATRATLITASTFAVIGSPSTPVLGLSASPGTWSWAAPTSSLTQLILADGGPSAINWAGKTATLIVPAVINADGGAAVLSWAGTTATLGQTSFAVVDTHDWAPKQKREQPKTAPPRHETLREQIERMVRPTVEAASVESEESDDEAALMNILDGERAQALEIVAKFGRIVESLVG